MKRTLALVLLLILALTCTASAMTGEPSSAGDGLMPYDQVLRLIKWIDEGYYKNKTYDEIVAFTGVEGLDKGHKDTSMTALGDHYFDWIADSDRTHYIHVCFRGRDDSGRFEACQWNTSGFKSSEWESVSLTDWLIASACRDTAQTSLQIQRFSNPEVTVTAQMPVSGWRTRVSSNTAYFYNDRGESNNDPRIEICTYDDPAMFDFYLAQYENVQPIGSRVIAGVEMKGRTYHTTGWDWTEYSAQLTDKVSICVKYNRLDCSAGTEGGALIDSLVLSWTENGTDYAFPGSAPIQPTPAVTAEPVPVVTETPAPTAAPVVTEAPALTDAFAPNDPIAFLPQAADRPAYWTEYTFTNELNGLALSFCMPMDADTAVSDFYAKKDPIFQQETGRAYFYWRYDAAGKTKMSFTVSHLYATAKEHEIESLTAHGTGGNTYTTLKTDRGFTIYRRVNNRNEYRWAIVSDPLSDGTRVLALVEADHNGSGGPWFDELVKAFEGTVHLTLHGLAIEYGTTEAPVVTPAPTAVSATPTPSPIVTAAPTQTPRNDIPALTAGDDAFAGTWYSTWIRNGGMDADPRTAYGFTMVLTLNADGTGEMDYLGSDGGGRWGKDEDGIVRYWGEGTSLSLMEDGSLCYGSYLSGYILFSKDKEATASVFPTNPFSLPTLAPVQTAEPVIPAAGGSGEYIGIKFIGKTYMAGGMSMDASILGGEYAILLNADGSADFTMAGMTVPGYRWTQGADSIAVDAYGTVVMTLTLQEDGTMLMDYSGAFSLIMVPQA